MQITFDTAAASPRELVALGRFIQDLAALSTAPEAVKEPRDLMTITEQFSGIVDTAPTPIAPADPPDAGSKIVKPGIVIPAIGTGKPEPVNMIAPADQPDAGSPPVDDQQAAAIFGAQRIDAAPVASVPGIPTAPAAPAAAASPASVTAPPSTAAAPSAGVELDSQGLPWDPRIHGSTKAKNADGTWRQRRGLNDPELKKKVEAELRATMALPAAPAAPVFTVANPVPGVPVAPAGLSPTDRPKPWEATEQYLAGTPTPPAPPVPPATFGAFMSEVSNLVAGKTMTSEHVTLKLQSIGLASIMALANRPDLIPTAWQALHS